MGELRCRKVLLPLCIEATTAFCIAAVYWSIDSNPILVIANAFWVLLFGVITLLVYRYPQCEDRLVQSFIGRTYRALRPYLLYVGGLFGAGFALAADFWWRRGTPLLTLVNAGWAVFFVTAGMLITLRGLRCAMAIICLAAGGLYLVTATWWFAEGYDIAPTRDTRFFCFNLMWCAILITAGLIIDRSRPPGADPLRPARR